MLIYDWNGSKRGAVSLKPTHHDDLLHIWHVHILIVTAISATLDLETLSIIPIDLHDSECI
jgi:hypothetical protein